jgi:3'(2'), 5'-bisphosphate nucleotidase
MTETQDVCQHLEAVCAIAAEAGRRILDVYERDFTVEEKKDGSPLTEADHAAHELIVARLTNLTPEVPILSEESGSVDYQQRAAWSRFWLVDPLDGTKEFVNRNGEFTVNIALIDKARPVLGVVYVPVPGMSYFACRNQGAFKQKGGCERSQVRARSFRGSNPIVATSRSHASEKLAEFLARMGPHNTVTMGSAMKFCLVAEGTADVYPRLGPTMEWDTAAAQCVVEEAGGRVLDVNNQPLTYNKKSLLNPWFVAGGSGDYDWTALLPRPKGE